MADEHDSPDEAQGPVTLFWRWADSPAHTERAAAYTDLDAARGQAGHDLAVCETSGDYTTAPVRIEDADGAVLWSADLPAAPGRP